VKSLKWKVSLKFEVSPFSGEFFSASFCVFMLNPTARIRPIMTVVMFLAHLFPDRPKPLPCQNMLVGSCHVRPLCVRVWSTETTVFMFSNFCYLTFNVIL